MCCRSRLTRHRQASTQRYQLHQIIPTHPMLVNLRVASEVAQPPHQIVLDLFTRRSLADDEGLMGKCAEPD